MNYKRALGFGALLWIFVFVAISILMFIPGLKDNQLRIQIAWWILEIPIVLFMAKWYFKADTPTAKKGFLLGVVGLVVGNILDMVITVPLFVGSYVEFYGSWMLYVGFVLLPALTTFAGWEFDGTYTKEGKGE